MATRQQIQIAQDLVKFVNIMNDLLDCASYILRETDPQTGGPYQITDPVTKELRSPTFEELKVRIKRIGQSVLGYWNTINDFIDGYGAINVRDALLSMGINVADIQGDLGNLETEGRHLFQNIMTATSKAELLTYADRLDANVPKLTLVRRSWCLEL